MLGVGIFLRWIYISLGALVLALVLILAAVVSIQELVVGERSVGGSVLSLEGRATDTNALVKYLEEKVETYIPWSDRVSQVLGVMPKTMKLKQVKKDEADGLVELIGVTETRSEIKEFQSRLEELPWVESVESPLQNLTVGTTAEFSLILTVEGYEDGS